MFRVALWLTALLLLICLPTLSGTSSVFEHVVKEGSDVRFQCALPSREDITSSTFDWKKDGLEVYFYEGGKTYNNNQRSGQNVQFHGRVSHLPEELVNGNGAIVIEKIKLSDAGLYTCVFPHLRPPQKFSTRLIVDATPEPFVTSLEATADWALLQCKVAGASTKTQVWWQDGAGTELPSNKTQPSDKDRYDIILSVNVTETDLYRCVVEQEDIKHRVSASIFMHISEKVCEDSSSKVDGWKVAALVLGALFVVAVAAIILLVVALCRKNGPRNQGDDPGNQGDDPGNQGDDPRNQGDDPRNQGKDPHHHGNGVHLHRNCVRYQGNGHSPSEQPFLPQTV